jgi:membrane protease YdiL (CAAX protease family)
MELTATVKKAAREQAKSVKALRLGQLLFFSQLTVMIAGPYFFPDNPISFQTEIIYMIIPIGFMIYSVTTQRMIESISLMRSLAFAILGFWLTYAFVLFMFGFVLNMQFGTIAYAGILPMILLQAVFVAPSEELAFRSIIPEYFQRLFPKRFWWFALILSQGAFATFHVTAYQGNLGAMAIAFCVGLVWLAASRIPYKGKPIGIGFTIGSHACYNLILSGVLVGNYSMMFGW